MEESESATIIAYQNPKVCVYMAKYEVFHVYFGKKKLVNVMVILFSRNEFKLGFV